MLGETEKLSHAEANSERETIGIRREGRGWCNVTGVLTVISGVGIGEEEQDELGDVCVDVASRDGSEDECDLGEPKADGDEMASNNVVYVWGYDSWILMGPACSS